MREPLSTITRLPILASRGREIFEIQDSYTEGSLTTRLGKYLLARQAESFDEPGVAVQPIARNWRTLFMLEIKGKLFFGSVRRLYKNSIRFHAYDTGCSTLISKEHVTAIYNVIYHFNKLDQAL